ncbi:3-phosphoshikimate 1-carboxyvinyltransferase [Thermopirellula anaerolimosa]
MSQSEAYRVPTCGPIQGSIRPPGSKSITNRALICAALAEGESELTGVLDSEDTQVMAAALNRLGIAVARSETSDALRVSGCGGRIPAQSAELFLANSGTSIRFLTAACCLGTGTFRLDGVPRMRERPIEDLLETLRQLGADARSELGNGCPPVIVQAHGLPGGTAEIAGTISSQFLSGVLMAAPCSHSGVVLHVRGDLVSKPYVDMTIAVMRSFGVSVRSEDYRTFTIEGDRRYHAVRYAVEPDASAAGYFFAAAAVTGGSVTVHGLSRRSLQGDVAFCDCLERMGCRVVYGEDSITVQGGPLRGIDVDMNAISDTAQTLAVTALFAEGPTTIRGIGHIRHKETDRIRAMVAELRKLGTDAEEQEDGLTIRPGPLRPAEIATYRDHRMAMSFAIAGLRLPGVVILDPGCTAKTYPGFFQDLERLIQGSSVEKRP